MSTSGGTSGGGGPGFTGASYDASITSDLWSQGVISAVTKPLDGVLLTGSGGAVLSLPVLTYAPGAAVWRSGGAPIGAAGIPDSASGFDLTVVVQISSLDGLNTMTVQGTTTLAAHTPSGVFDPATLAMTDQAGADLVLAAGNVTTTAGGVYASVTTFSLHYPIA